MSNLSLVAKISGKSIVRWFSVFLPGFFLSLVFLAISIYLLYDNNGGGHAVHTNSGLALFFEFIRLAIVEPFPFALFVMSVIMMPLSYTMATKFSLSSAFYDIWNGSLKEWFFSKILYYLEVAKSKSDGLKKVDKVVTEKARIIQAIRADDEASRFQKKLLTFIMNKVHLEDTDFSNPNVKYSDIVIEKIKDTASDFFYPSRKNIYYLYLLHILLFVLALVFNK